VSSIRGSWECISTVHYPKKRDKASQNGQLNRDKVLRTRIRKLLIKTRTFDGVGVALGLTLSWSSVRLKKARLEGAKRGRTLGAEDLFTSMARHSFSSSVPPYE
jgi:hypothetical protein